MNIPSILTTETWQVLLLENNPKYQFATNELLQWLLAVSGGKWIFEVHRATDLEDAKRLAENKIHLAIIALVDEDAELDLIIKQEPLCRIPLIVTSEGFKHIMYKGDNPYFKMLTKKNLREYKDQLTELIITLRKSGDIKI